MSTAFSATVKATAEKPYILTHRVSGERYAYSEAHLARTRAMYARAGLPAVERTYSVVREFPAE